MPKLSDIQTYLTNLAAAHAKLKADHAALVTESATIKTQLTAAQAQVKTLTDAATQLAADAPVMASIEKLIAANPV